MTDHPTTTAIAQMLREMYRAEPQTDPGDAVAAALRLIAGSPDEGGLLRPHMPRDRALHDDLLRIAHELER